jgi:hypothetical protein
MATQTSVTKAEPVKKNHLERQPQPPVTAGLEGAVSSLELGAALSDPQSARPEAILQLQRMAGNRAVSGLIQRKLTVGAANDPYEQEADRVAAQVMSMPESTPKVQRMGEEDEEIQAKPLAATITPLVQRAVAPEEDEELQAKFIQRESIPEEDEELQAKSFNGGNSFEPGLDFESRLAASQGSGSPLPTPTRQFMEQRFGADFSGVRVHTGNESNQLNHAVGAQAFTHGQNIYFGQDKENMESRAGKQLLAHELTHIVQQTGKTVRRVIGKVPAPYRPTLPGHAVNTEFGNYWVVPNGTTRNYREKAGDQITKTDFAILERAWNALKSDAGNIHIRETDDLNSAHGGFKNKVLDQFKELLSRQHGRGLVINLMNSTKPVTIMPTSARKTAVSLAGPGARETSPGVAGAGDETTIMIDDDLTDDRVKAFDATGHKIYTPVYLILGHELIHARHNIVGQNRRNQAPTEPAYGNLEEEQTISTGTLTENMLRKEHSLPLRFGHKIKVGPP